MSNAKYIKEGYVHGLNREQREFMELFNLKVFAGRSELSYNLLRKAVKGEEIPGSIDKGIWLYLDNLAAKIKSLEKKRHGLERK